MQMAFRLSLSAACARSLVRPSSVYYRASHAMASNVDVFLDESTGKSLFAMHLPVCF